MWHGVVQDVKEMVGLLCDHTGEFVHTISSPYLQIEKSDVCHRVKVHSPWYHLGIDFVGPLPEASDGSKYILTISDYFSKRVEALGIPNKEAVTGAEALFKV